MIRIFLSNYTCTFHNNLFRKRTQTIFGRFYSLRFSTPRNFPHRSRIPTSFNSYSPLPPPPPPHVSPTSPTSRYQFFTLPLHHSRLQPLSFLSHSNVSSTYFPRFSVHLISSVPLPAIDETTTCGATRNAAPTFALIYVEHADSPRVAKHTGPSEKRKHRRAVEDNRRRPPPSPGTVEIVLAPLGTLRRRGYFRPPRCSLSLPLRCPRYSADFLAIAGKSHARRFRKSRLCEPHEDLGSPTRQKHRSGNRAQFIFSEDRNIRIITEIYLKYI